MKTFRDKVIEHRAALGLSQQQLADKAGIGVRTIGNYESGARLPYAAQLYKLAKALGVSTEYLKNDEIVNIPVRQHRKSGRRETVCPGLRKPLMRVYSRNVLSKP